MPNILSETTTTQKLNPKTIILINELYSGVCSLDTTNEGRTTFANRLTTVIKSKLKSDLQLYENTHEKNIHKKKVSQLAYKRKLFGRVKNVRVVVVNKSDVSFLKWLGGNYMPNTFYKSFNNYVLFAINELKETEQ